MIEELLPATVSVAESSDDPPDAFLLPEEEPAVLRAVGRRRREYTTVRHCARSALARLGFGPVPVLSGARGEPLWPAGVCGSMTHCDGYRAAVVALVGDVRALGVDAEPHAPLTGDVRRMIAAPAELARIAELGATHPAVHWDRIVFSAKESVYKAWFPAVGRWLGFEDVDVVVDPGEGYFVARVRSHDPALDPPGFGELIGRWLVRDGLVLTAVTVLRDASGTA